MRAVSDAPGPATPAGQALAAGGRRDILSRVAERVYWLGRYIERVESTARLVTVTSNLLMDLPLRLPLGWRPLIDITGSGPLFDSLFDEANEHNVCRFLISDTRNPGSIIRSIEGVRENARTVRETMPRVTFEYVNDLHHFARSELAPGTSRRRRREALDGVGSRVHQFEGFLSRNMLHDAHWTFLRLGNQLERADMTTRTIDVGSANLLTGHDLEAFHEAQWRSVLISLYAMQSYHAAVGQPVSRAPVLEFLLRAGHLPRSYARCLAQMRSSVRDLPRNRRPMRNCNSAIVALANADVTGLEGPTLRAFMDDCQKHLGRIHDSVAETWFHFQPKPNPKDGKLAS
ncbi:MAG: alpha-E domain-containing protein [Gammaproteobacteria bacterium]|nr:alpha-E domain-containing protein [Gammaproteobacteria bacterium]